MAPWWRETHNPCTHNPPLSGQTLDRRWTDAPASQRPCFPSVHHVHDHAHDAPVNLGAVEWSMSVCLSSAKPSALWALLRWILCTCRNSGAPLQSGVHEEPVRGASESRLDMGAVTGTAAFSRPKRAALVFHFRLWMASCHRYRHNKHFVQRHGCALGVPFPGLLALLPHAL